MSKPQKQPVSGGVTRRELLEYSALGLLTAGIPAHAAQSAKARNLELFLDLSQKLTANDKLNATTSERIFLAMGGHKRAFTEPLARLAAALDQPASTWGEEDRQLAGQIVKAWYLGRVGDGPDATVVAYEHALMFEAVQHALAPRSFCAAQPGYWATLPG